MPAAEGPKAVYEGPLFGGVIFLLSSEGLFFFPLRAVQSKYQQDKVAPVPLAASLQGTALSCVL